MSRQELKARDKLRSKMSKDGLVEINETKGEVKRVSRREAQLSLNSGVTDSNNFSPRGRQDATRKKRRGQQRDEKFRESQEAQTAQAAQPAEPSGEPIEYVQENGALTPGTETAQSPVLHELAHPQADPPPGAPRRMSGHEGKPSKLQSHKQSLYEAQPDSPLRHERHDATDLTSDPLVPSPGSPGDVAEPEHKLLFAEPSAKSKSQRRQRRQPAAEVQRDSVTPLTPAAQPHSQLRHEQPGLSEQPPVTRGKPPQKSIQRPAAATQGKANTQALSPESKASSPLRHEQPADPPQQMHTDSPSQQEQRNTQRQETPDALHKPEQPTAGAQADPDSKLRFTPDEAAPSPDPTAKPDRVSRKLAVAERQAGRSAAKLEQAQSRLPTKRVLHSERVFDEATGTAKRKLHFETEVKSQGEYLRGPLPLRPVKAAGNAALAYGHRKMFQVERENVGTEAAHKTEMAAEGAVRCLLHSHKTAPYRKVARLERSAAKKSRKLSYQRALVQNPKLQSNPLSRFMQKQKIRRQYAKAARDAQKAARRTKAAGSLASRAGKALAGVIRRHPFAAVIVILALLFLGVLLSLFGLASGVGGGGLSGILGAAYLADNAEINSAEIAYTEWETDLREEIENVEADHPGYDEYRYELDGVGHDPLALMAYLTAEYLDYSFAAIESELRAIFDEQYALAFEETTEMRYRDPDDSDGDGDTEPYDWYILTVRLETTPLEDILEGRMDEEKYNHYDNLMDTNGGRQYAGSPFAFDWRLNITSHYGWRADPHTGEKSFHTGVDIGVPTGTPIIAAHDGVVTKIVNGTTGYGKYIVVEGENGLSTRYAHCDALLAAVGQTVKQGDVIAASGNTGNSTGPHLHFEVMVDGETLNPIYFANLEA